ncbi:MAG: hypothetical protein MRY83_06285 [Flavobacteriales bacterium]|nr:hypothetical protein [Flavobacteriales bacterium]
MIQVQSYIPKLLSLAVGLFALSLFLPLKANLFAIYFLGLASLISFIKSGATFKFQKELWPVLALFGYLTLSLIWTENLNEGQFELERKASLVVFPIILSLSRSHMEQVKRVFFDALLLGAVVVSLFLIVIAILAYIDFHRLPVHHDLSNAINAHAVYLSLLLTLALFWIPFRKNGVANFILGIPILLTLIFLASKIFLTIIAIVAMGFFYTRVPRKLKVLTILTFAVSCLAILLLSPVRERVKDIDISNVNIALGDHFDYNTRFDGLSIRLFLLRAGVEDVFHGKQMIIGHGIGDFQDRLNQKIIDYNLYIGNEEFNDTGYFNYNYHNQYMQITSQAGIIALIILLIIMVSAFIKTLISSDYFLLISITSMTIWFLTESVLQKQLGIVLFSFLYSLILARSSNEVK